MANPEPRRSRGSINHRGSASGGTAAVQQAQRVQQQYEERRDSAKRNSNLQTQFPVPPTKNLNMSQYAPEITAKINEIKIKKDRSLLHEDYESAAKYRDQIHELHEKLIKPDETSRRNSKYVFASPDQVFDRLGLTGVVDKHGNKERLEPAVRWTPSRDEWDAVEYRSFLGWQEIFRFVENVQNFKMSSKIIVLEMILVFASRHGV